MDDEMRYGEIFLSKVLKYGLILSLLIAFLGGVLFLWQHGNQSYDFHVFKGDLHQLANFEDIANGILHYRGFAIMQLGILFLIATPVARVAACVFIFALQRDYMYVGIAGFVLMILFYSLFWRTF